MDCHNRKWRALALALGVGWVGGCQHDRTTSNGAPVVQVKNQMIVTEKENPGPKRPPKPDTCVAAGDFYAREAVNKDRGSAAQEQLRESARKAYQQALTLDPRYIPAHHALAQLYTAMDDHEHAVAIYQQALKIQPREPQLHFQLGMCYGRLKDWPAAVTSLQKAVDLDPENRPFVNTLGFALARAGRYPDSLACFGRVHSPAMAHCQLARMLRHLQQPELCRQQLLLALEKEPNLEVAQKLLTSLERPAPPVQTVGYETPAEPGEPQEPGRPLPVEVRPDLSNSSRQPPSTPRPLPPTLEAQPLGGKVNR
jgi:tetratricopeptide (TPR) repeat protein